MQNFPRALFSRSTTQPIAQAYRTPARIFQRLWDGLMHMLAPVGHETERGFAYGPCEREQFYLSGLPARPMRVPASGHVPLPGCPLHPADDGIGSLAVARMRSR